MFSGVKSQLFPEVAEVDNMLAVPGYAGCIHVVSLVVVELVEMCLLLKLDQMELLQMSCVLRRGLPV
jgi:hypothetical protein